jgi:ABC-type iron transport system FetAB permease component
LKEQLGAFVDLALAVIHAIIGLLIIGYAQNYYFHLRES